jgi:hypothetical protein
MRRAVLIVLTLALAACPAVAATSAPGGSLLVEGGVGTVQIKGKGVLVGRIDKGSLQITDATPADKWSPRVNGVPRGKTVWIRGSRISFYIPGGSYKIVAHGEGISVSARGTGQAVLTGDPAAVAGAGVYAVGDDPEQSVPLEPLRVAFGTLEQAPSGRAGRIEP